MLWGGMVSFIPRLLLGPVGKGVILMWLHVLELFKHLGYSVLTRIFRLKDTNNICDPAPHLECSDSQYQTLVACVPLSTKDSKSSSMFTEFCSQSPDSS